MGDAKLNLNLLSGTDRNVQFVGAHNDVKRNLSKYDTDGYDDQYSDDDDDDPKGRLSDATEKRYANYIFKKNAGIRILGLVFGALFFLAGTWQIVDTWGTWAPESITTYTDYINAGVFTVAPLHTIPPSIFTGISMVVLGIAMLVVFGVSSVFYQMMDRVLNSRANMVWLCCYSVFYSLFYVSLFYYFGVRHWAVTLIGAVTVFAVAAFSSISGWWAKLSALGSVKRMKRINKEGTVDEKQRTLEDVRLTQTMVLRSGIHHMVIMAIKSLMCCTMFAILITYFVYSAIYNVLSWQIIILFVFATVVPLFHAIVEIAFTGTIRDIIIHTELAKLLATARSESEEKGHLGMTQVAILQKRHLIADMVIQIIGLTVLFVFIQLEIHV
jgi:hypothetical protein